MFTRILTCLLSGAALLFILTTAPVRATDFNVTNGVSLAAAVAAANDEIANPGADTILLVGNPTIVLLAPLEITSDITIEGPGTLDGGGLPMLYLIALTGEEVTLSKLTIQNCYTEFGAIARNAGGSLTVSCCKFLNNQAICSLDPNSGRGGAIDNYHGALIVTDSEFSGNCADDQGGAIFFVEGVLAINGSSFKENWAGTSGGAISSTGDLLELCDDVFCGNCVGPEYIGEGYGGAIAALGCVIAERTGFFNNRVVNEYGPSFGGAVISGFDSAFVNCAFSANRAIGTITGEDVGSAGGALFAVGDLLVRDCTIAGNVAKACSLTEGDTAFSLGGGIYMEDGEVSIGNTILWGNRADAGDEQLSPFNAIAQVTYSDVQGGWSGVGNKNADPLFVLNPNPFTGNAGILILRNTSPCVNTGSNALIPGGVTTDLPGFPRIINVTVDMGAYELTAAEQAINNLIIQVQDLVTAGALLPGEGQSLISKLQGAQAELACGDTTDARGCIKAFNNQVKALAKTKKCRLTTLQANALAASANAILGML